MASEKRAARKLARRAPGVTTAHWSPSLRTMRRVLGTSSTDMVPGFPAQPQTNAATRTQPLKGSHLDHPPCRKPFRCAAQGKAESLTESGAKPTSEVQVSVDQIRLHTDELPDSS